MFGKIIFFLVTAAIVYAPPIPHTYDDGDEAQPFRTKTPKNLDEACIMIGELRQDLSRKSKALKEAYVAIGPAVFTEHTAQFLQKSVAIARDDMVNAINMTTEQVNKEISELLPVTNNGMTTLNTALVDMAGTYLVRCRYNLAFPEDEDMKALKRKLFRDIDIDEHIFCHEMTFLHMRTWKMWSFAKSFTIPLDLDTILDGLRLYKLADNPATVKAVFVFYDSQIKK